MSRLVEALKKVGQTFKLFQRGEIGPCGSTTSPVSVPNLVPSTFCQIPASVPIEEKHITRGLVGKLFEFDKTFMLPSARSSVQALKWFYKNNPGGELLIVGHTDTKGPPDYNLELSKRRAKNMVAYLEHDVEIWMAYYYYQPQAVSKQWGTLEDQYMLSVLPEGGPHFYTDTIDGLAGPNTEKAITQFQEFSNANRGTTLPVNGIAGLNITRPELIKAYMERGGKKLPKGEPIFSQGCGEFHPEVPTGDEVEEEQNRRVDVFFFPDKIDPPMPVGGCRAPGCIEYPQWRARATRTIDFTKNTYDLLVKVTEEGTQPPLAVFKAEVRVVCPSRPGDLPHQLTDESGRARFSNLASGTYQINVRKEGFADASKEVTHPSDQMQTASFVGESTLAAPVLMQLLPAGQSQPQARDPYKEEAFFPNEWAASKTARGLHANRFAQIGDNIELSVANPLGDELSVAELKKLPNGLDKYTISMYIPVNLNPLGDVKVTILFAVGTEVRRHGLRSLFAKSTDRVLVLVPGVEPSHTVLNRAWGRGITAVMIHQLFIKKYDNAIPSWTVDILGAYSTGYRGLNGTIRNFADKPIILDLIKTSMVVIYDALYKGDPPPKPGHNTQRALEKINVATNKKVRLAVYEVTGAGTPRDGGDTRVPQPLLKQTFGHRYRLLNLKPLRQALFALIYARMFDAAVKDGYFPASSLPQPLQKLMVNLPLRFQVASVDPSVVSSNTSLAAWAATHAVDVAGLLQKHLKTLRKDKIANSKFLLMGWPVPFIDDILHDGFIPEFGHEFLRGVPFSVHPQPRISIWASHALAKDAVPGIHTLIKETLDPNGKSALSDISALMTVRPQAADYRLVEWDPEFPQAAGGNKAKIKARYEEVIDLAHAKGIKVLAGYEAVKDPHRQQNPNAGRFMQFVKAAVEKKGNKEVLVKNTYQEDVCVVKPSVVNTHVDAISNFLYKDPASKLDWDGISFDIEIGALLPRYRPVLRALYHGLAKKHPDKLVTFATFGFTARLKGRKGKPVGHKYQETQTFDLCEGHSNIIARPMLYEETVDEAYVYAICQYAFWPKPVGVGLERHQVQMGIQGDLQPGQTNRASRLTDNTEVISMIQNVLRPYECGLIYFGLFNHQTIDTARMKFFPTLDKTYRMTFRPKP